MRTYARLYLYKLPVIEGVKRLSDLWKEKEARRAAAKKESLAPLRSPAPKPRSPLRISDIREPVCLPSRLHPEHPFRIGVFDRLPVEKLDTALREQLEVGFESIFGNTPADRKWAGRPHVAIFARESWEECLGQARHIRAGWVALGERWDLTHSRYPQMGESWWHWHRDALDVVVETCEWVLAQPDPHQCAFHWGDVPGLAGEGHLSLVRPGQEARY